MHRFKSFIYLLCYLLISNHVLAQCEEYDLSVVGFISHADGIGRQAVGVIDLLRDDLNVNFIQTRPCNFKDISIRIQEIVNKPTSSLATVSLLEEAVWYPGLPTYEKVPNNYIKLAYSLWESTEIPQEWVKIFNEHFDAVVVADSYFIKVYKDSGVTIPIFEVPLGVYIEKYLEYPQKKSQNRTFIFGSAVSFEKRKNHALLIQAFAEEFGNDPKVMLKLNGRYGDIVKLKKQAFALGITNIIITNEVLSSRVYDAFIKSFDCFVNISKGEGFSICPREALALGIPCVLANNTAQKSICDTGYVCNVPSEIPEKSYFMDSGYYFDCTKEDVKKALREVYEQYDDYLAKAQEGRVWVKQFLWSSLKAKYMNLIKPKVVILGDKNIITDTYLMTDSVELYEKYLKVSQNWNTPTQVPYL